MGGSGLRRDPRNQGGDRNGHILSTDTSASAEGALEGGKSHCNKELSLSVRGTGPGGNPVQALVVQYTMRAMKEMPGILFFNDHYHVPTLDRKL